MDELEAKIRAHYNIGGETSETPETSAESKKTGTKKAKEEE